MKFKTGIASQGYPAIVDGQNTNLISDKDYVWKDEKSNFVIKATSGSNNPSFGEYIPGFQGILFSGTSLNQIWVDFHIDHDIALNTQIFPHVHWMPLNDTTGTVRWGFEYIIAKGHGQSAFPSSSTIITVDHTVPLNSKFKHMITEVPQNLGILSSEIEPDTVIKMRIFRDGVNDTHNFNVHAWQADLHYQVARIGTKRRMPNFFV